MPNGSCLPEFSQIFSPNPHLFSSYTSWMSASVHSRTSGPSAFSVWNPLGDGVFPFFPVGSLWTPSVLTTGLPPPTVSFYRHWGILVATSRPPPLSHPPNHHLPHLPNERPAPRLLPRAVVPPLHHSPGGSCCLPVVSPSLICPPPPASRPLNPLLLSHSPWQSTPLNIT